jgi:hypothetical protein
MRQFGSSSRRGCADYDALPEKERMVRAATGEAPLAAAVGSANFPELAAKFRLEQTGASSTRRVGQRTVLVLIELSMGAGNMLRAPRGHKQNPATEGRDGVSALGPAEAALTSLPSEQLDAPSAEQTRNRDHKSSDPCGQANKQQKLTHEKSHAHASPLAPP